MLVINDRLQVPLREFDFTFVRSRGPGGQNVNKVNTKAVLHWAVCTSPSLPEGVRQRFLAKFARRINKEGQLVITSQRFRDQGRNVADCLKKLREMLVEVATPPRYRKKTRPPRAAAERRLKNKQATSRKKEMRRPPSRD